MKKNAIIRDLSFGTLNYSETSIKRTPSGPKSGALLTINFQRLLCTVIKFHVVKDAKEAELYMCKTFRKTRCTEAKIFLASFAEYLRTLPCDRTARRPRPKNTPFDLTKDIFGIVKRKS